MLELAMSVTSVLGTGYDWTTVLTVSIGILLTLVVIVIVLGIRSEQKNHEFLEHQLRARDAYLAQIAMINAKRRKDGLGEILP